MKVRFEWTVPNLLSLLRLVLIPVFVVMYLLSDDRPGLLYGSVGVLVLSGISDGLDGFIARKFHQISESGKLLDPLADKLTQVAVLLCLTVRHLELIPLLVICAVKEILQLIGGLIILHNGIHMEASHWYGKLATFVFYGTMAVFLFFDLPGWLSSALVLLVAVLMINSFFHYLLLYLRLRRDTDAPSGTEDADRT